MHRHLRTIGWGALALALLSGTSLAQSPTPPSPSAAAPPAAAPGSAPPSGAGAVFDPSQLPATTGTVQQFTLTPRGDIDGLILRDGTEVTTPPHLSTAIAFSIKPGDAVTVHGLRAAVLPLVQAVSITNDASGQTIVDTGPPGPGHRPAGPPAPGMAPPAPPLSETQGRVRMALYGRQGEVNGALLEDGTILRLPPPEAYRLGSLLAPGQTVVADGYLVSGPLGRVVQVTALGPARDQLSEVQAPPEPHGGKKGRRGPPPPPNP